MLEFYETILNTTKWDTKKVISIIDRLIKLEMLENKISINNIYNKLTEFGINAVNVNLNELYVEMKSHNFLVVNFQDENGFFNYVLIDPTYEQFVKKDNAESPLYFDAWPSEILQNINPNLLKNLIQDRYSYIDDKNLQDYLRSFTNKPVNINLESIILGNYKEKNRRF